MGRQFIVIEEHPNGKEYHLNYNIIVECVLSMMFESSDCF